MHKDTSKVGFYDPNVFNFKVDHMTLLVDPRLYGVAYVCTRILFGVPALNILYNKTKVWNEAEGERSMTFASMIGEGGVGEDQKVDKTIVAIVQPTEPKSQSSHVRDMLQQHNAASHWQHIALRTPDLLTFHQFATQRGVNFITPILKDEEEDLIQVFSGEWYYPGSTPSAMFFEFVQRNPSERILKNLEERNRESWFQDKTFMGLYQEKENEYRRGQVVPFIDFALFEMIDKKIAGREIFRLDDTFLRECEEIMLAYAAKSK